jgi:hypothetical protein
MYNSSPFPFQVAVIMDDRVKDLGVLNKAQKRNCSVGDGSK